VVARMGLKITKLSTENKEWKLRNLEIEKQLKELGIKQKFM
jgi:hypothetical protein